MNRRVGPLRCFDTTSHRQCVQMGIGWNGDVATVAAGQVFDVSGRYVRKCYLPERRLWSHFDRMAELIRAGQEQSLLHSDCLPS